eukprot:TRINITY_DN24052_c0_g2_i1.p1 TRINITY_DN24052_c0_g2~~TRINITY_DN24052_c0_g2_i1.p1  ORF type:complete len:1132 (-),score=194.61 TRINITY_DN24052_c0_g2_i1:65-3460(-)
MERRPVGMLTVQTQGWRIGQKTQETTAPEPIPELDDERKPAGPVSTKVIFRTVNSGVQYGHTVRAVGNIESLGFWDPAQGLSLSTDEELFPCWVSQNAIFIPLNREVEYKYAVVDSHGHLVSWEEYSGNRSFCTSGPEMIIEDDDGLVRQMAGNTDDASDDEEIGPIGMRTKTPVMTKMSKEEKLSFVHDLEGKVTIEENTTVFMVALKLPVLLQKVGEGKDTSYEVIDTAPTDGRNFAFLPLMQELRQKMKARFVCVGWPGIHVPERERPRIVRLLSKHDCIPIWPPQKQFEMFHDFCHKVLWPIFHDVMLFFQTSNPMPFDEKGWAAYQQINNFYGTSVAPLAHENDLIWIHDYHLLMTPMCISRKFQMANIGFFLHTPFPSSDSFKSLPVREEILSGMLCADQVGFQFFDNARNFLVSLKRIYGLDPVYRAGGFMGVEYGGRNVMIKVAHFVYPFADTTDLIQKDERISDKAAEVRRIFGKKTVFACMDREDGLSGMLPKFTAFKQFLKEHPERKGNCVLVQYIFTQERNKIGQSRIMDTLRCLADGYLKNDEKGALQVEQKNADKAGDIFIRLDAPDRIDRLAMFRAADVFLDTSVKAGLNLMPFEFITAHHDDSKNHAVVLVSEFSGCSQVLLGSLRLNPWNTEQVVSACELAVTMDDAEKKERLESNLLYMSQSSPMSWFQDFMDDLRRARKTTSMVIETLGFGAKIRHVCVGQDFVKLPMSLVVKAYRSSKNRVIFLDSEIAMAADAWKSPPRYGATKSDQSVPDARVIDCLSTLLSDSYNTIVLVSGRDREVLEEWFGDMDRIGLCAEGGFYYKLPIATGGTWHCLADNPDYTWKTYAWQTMKQFAKRTQGAFIEDRGSAITWTYCEGNQHFGSLQAKELSSHLQELLFGFDVDVCESKGYVEVKLRGIDKGVVVSKCLAKIAANFGDADFVLCIGGDRSDEDMFEAVNALVDPSEETSGDGGSQKSTTDADSDITNEDRKDSLGGRAGGFRMSSMTMTRKKSGMMSALGGGSISGNLQALGGGSGLDDEAYTLHPSGKLRRFFTCTIGRKPSAAKFFLNDTEEISELLVTLKSLHDRKQSLSSHTWSSGDAFAKNMRVGSMPALSSLSFARSRGQANFRGSA